RSAQVVTCFGRPTHVEGCTFVSRAGECDGIRRGIVADAKVPGLKRRCIGAHAAADVDHGLCPIRWQDGIDDGAQDLTPGREPPVSLLHLRVYAKNISVHYDHSSDGGMLIESDSALTA